MLEETTTEEPTEPETHLLIVPEMKTENIEDIEEDKVLNDILVICESLYRIEPTPAIKETVDNCIMLVDKKIEYFENLQTSFSLINHKKRIADVAKYLTAFTLGESQHDMMSDFSFKVSILLDLLHSNRTILTQYNLYHFDDIVEGPGVAEIHKNLKVFKEN